MFLLSADSLEPPQGLEAILATHSWTSLPHYGHTSPPFCKVLLGRHRGAQQQPRPSIHKFYDGKPNEKKSSQNFKMIEDFWFKQTQIKNL